MKKFALIAVPLCLFALATLAPAQMNMSEDKSKRPSPPAGAQCKFSDGKTVKIDYSSPRAKGRKIFGEASEQALVPYGQVWRTGANPATTIVTSVPLKFGSLLVPAGTHTLFSLPSPDIWQLILSNDVGEWGLDYKPAKDLGRVPMKAKPMAAPQEVMSLSFENTTPKSTELHIRWETTDRYVTITAP